MEETMHEAMCGCSKKLVDLNDANYVLNGVPLCSRNCFNSYVAAEARKARARLDLARREEATRIVGSFEDGFHVVVG
jgi:hypothetical protein